MSPIKQYERMMDIYANGINAEDIKSDVSVTLNQPAINEFYKVITQQSSKPVEKSTSEGLPSEVYLI